MARRTCKELGWSTYPGERTLMYFPDQNWPYLLFLKQKELVFAVVALGRGW